MSISKHAVAAVAACALVCAALAACDRNGPTPGQKLDNALDATGEKVKEAGEAIKTK